MIFNINFSAIEGKFKFGKDSALVKFFIDDNRLRKNVSDFYSSIEEELSGIQKRNFFGENGNELLFFSTKKEPAVIYNVKIRLDDKFDIDYFRNYFAGLLPSLRGKNIGELHISIPGYADFKSYFPNENYLVQTIVEGVSLGNYSFDNYKTDRKKAASLKVLLHHEDAAVVRKVLKQTLPLMDSVFFARDLVNEPAITLTPVELAKRIKRELSQTNLKVKVYSKNDLKKMKMNAILAVGGASDNEPCLISIHYKPVRARKKIALVGKGVTYDSGGLSIKPTSGMLEMKADMAGGATVAGTIKAAAKLNLPVELIGIIPAVENMINGSAFKPGDVIKSYSGKTIEVKDTDAEGRVILADALHFAVQQKPDRIIDFATLTGACAVALGLIAAGLFTKDDRLAGEIISSSEKTYEKVWRLPFWDKYNELIKSEIADVSNLGPRWGGAITAGKFLERFVDKKIPWAHIDIAGPAIKHDASNYTKKYDTGFGVRLMIDYLQKI